jgi:hypothetical protein
MSTRLKKHGAFLRYAAKLPAGKERTQLLKNASSDEMKTICEICSNMQNGQIRMSEKQRRQLCRYKKQIRRMANRKLSLAAKRKIVGEQKGGFIGTLLGIALPLLSSLFAAKS